MAKWYEEAIFYHIYPLGLLGAFVWRLPIASVYLLLSLEECIRFAISMAVFRRKRWMRRLG